MGDMAEKRRVRVRRIVEIEGTEEWVRDTLSRSVQVTTPMVLGMGRIDVISQHEVGSTTIVPWSTQSQRPPLVYVAGPFGSDTWHGHEKNVEAAAAYRMPLAQLGCYPVVPHCNTRNLGGITGFDPDANMQEFWYQGSLELLRRCDCIVMIPGWDKSRGAQRERAAAEGWNIAVLYAESPEELHEVRNWLEWRNK